MPSPSQTVERAKPLLGTRVAVRVNGLSAEAAHKAIDAAFAEIATVHALMSFHETASDVSRLNRQAHLEPVLVDERTYEVLRRAQTVSAASDGIFDITVAPHLVSRTLLPQPEDASTPDGNADWRDIALLPGNRVFFGRPLWIDLGGIAKGYAVDRAAEILLAFAPSQIFVNAGGDLRVAGCEDERVALDTGHDDRNAVPVVVISNGSVASSNGRAHIDTRNGAGCSARRFVSVMAPSCTDADALTKIVMARGADSAPSLSRFGAWAVLYEEDSGWQKIAGSA